MLWTYAMVTVPKPDRQLFVRKEEEDKKEKKKKRNRKRKEKKTDKCRVTKSSKSRKVEEREQFPPFCVIHPSWTP